MGVATGGSRRHSGGYLSSAPRNHQLRNAQGRAHWLCQTRSQGSHGWACPCVPAAGIECREPGGDTLIRPRSPVLDSVRDINGLANRCRFRERRSHVYMRR